MAENKVLVDLNFNNNEIKDVVLHKTVVSPTSKEGKVFYDSNSGVKAPKFHNGTDWKKVVSSDELPIVNDGTLTIQKNGSIVQTFSANSHENKTANITVPSRTSEITNDSGFITKEVNNLTNYTKTSDLPSVATSGNFADLQNKPTTIAGYGITDAYTKTEVDNKVASVYKYKGSVSTYQNLPSTGLTVGDVYNVASNGANYAWDGSSWDKLGENVDLSPCLLKTEAASTYATKTTTNGLDSRISALESRPTELPLEQGAGISIRSKYTDDTVLLANLTANANDTVGGKSAINPNGAFNNTLTHFGQNSYYMNSYNTSSGYTSEVKTLKYDISEYTYGDFTIDIWGYRANINHPGNMPVIALQDASDKTLFQLAHGGHSYVMGDYKGGGVDGINPAVAQWHHYALVYNSATNQVHTYVDGARAGTYDIGSDNHGYAGIVKYFYAGNYQYHVAALQGLRIRTGIKYTGDTYTVPSGFGTATATSAKVVTNTKEPFAFKDLNFNEEEFIVDKTGPSGYAIQMNGKFVTDDNLDAKGLVTKNYVQSAVRSGSNISVTEGTSRQWQLNTVARWPLKQGDMNGYTNVEGTIVGDRSTWGTFSNPSGYSEEGYAQYDAAGEGLSWASVGPLVETCELYDLRSFTLEGWVKILDPENTGSGYAGLSLDDNWGDTRLSVTLSYNSTNGSYANGMAEVSNGMGGPDPYHENSQYYYASAEVQDGLADHHLAIVCDEGEIRWYVDGVQMEDTGYLNSINLNGYFGRFEVGTPGAQFHDLRFSSVARYDEDFTPSLDLYKAMLPDQSAVINLALENVTGYDDSKTQVLKHVNGTLQWVTEEQPSPSQEEPQEQEGGESPNDGNENNPGEEPANENPE